MDLKTTYKIDTQVKGASQLTGLKKGMKGVSEQTNKTASAMSRLKTSAGGAMNAMRGLLPLIGTAAIAKLANDTLQLGDKLQKMSEKTGASVAMLDRLRQASNLAGTDFNALTRLFPMLAKNIVQVTEKGTGPAAEAFKKLGINTTDAAGNIRASEQVLLDIADKFAAMKNGTEKADLAYKLFGARVGADLIPMLNMGRDSIEGLNTGFNQLSAERMAAFNDSMSNLGEALRLVAVTMTESLLPVLERVVSIVSIAAQWFSRLPKPVQMVSVGFGALAGAAIALTPLLAGLVFSIKTLAALKIGALVASFVGGLGAIGGAVGGLLPVVAGLFTGPVGWIALLGATVAAIWKFRAQIGEAFQKIGQALRAPFEGIGQYVSSVYSGIAQNIRQQMNSLFGWAVGLYNRAVAMINRARSMFSRGGSRGGGGRRGGRRRRAASGGVFDTPTNVLLGEGGQGEYVVPFSKAGAFARNITGGLRGPAAIPRMAGGGAVMPSTANVSITTGPVTQMDGQNFVTTQDMSRAVSSGVQQTLSLLRSDINVRRRVGLA